MEQKNKDEVDLQTKFRNTIFVISERYLQSFFWNTEDYIADQILLDELIFYTEYFGDKIFVCGKHFDSLKSQLGDEGIAQLEAVFCDGSEITGSGTFKDNLKDLLFLCGALQLVNPKKTIILLHEDTKLRRPSPELMKKFMDVISKVFKMGLKKFKLTIHNLSEIRTILLTIDKEYKQIYESLSGGTF